MDASTQKTTDRPQIDYKNLSPQMRALYENTLLRIAEESRKSAIASRKERRIAQIEADVAELKATVAELQKR